MKIKTEAVHAGEFVVSEGNGGISRESVAIAAGDALPAGQVLGINATTGVYGPHDAEADDGTQVAAGILYAPLPGSEEVRRGPVVVRLAEVSGELLTGLADSVTADLKSRYVIVR